MLARGLACDCVMSWALCLLQWSVAWPDLFCLILTKIQIHAVNKRNDHFLSTHCDV